MSHQNLNRQYSSETLSSLTHTKKLLDPSAYKNYLGQQSSLRYAIEEMLSQQKKLEPVFSDLNYTSRNFGNLCDRVFREQTKSSQKQKFGVRDKEQALKNLALQQDNLNKLKLAKLANGGGIIDRAKTRPVKDAGLNDKRGFLKKVVEFNNMKMILMFKSIEIEAIKKGQPNVSIKGKKRISQLVLFEDLNYLVENFNPDEISDLFKKCISIQKNKIQIDYKKFAALPPKKPSGGLLDKQNTFPQQQDFLQEESTENKDNEDKYSGKYLLKVQFPQIEMYASEIVHKQMYYPKKKDILDLFKTKFESLNEYLRHFDKMKANKLQSNIESAIRSTNQIDLTVPKSQPKRLGSDLSEKNKYKDDDEEQSSSQKHIQGSKNNIKPLEEDIKMKQFQDSLNEKLKTISEQQQQTQNDEDDEDDQQYIIRAIGERNQKKSSSPSEKSKTNVDEEQFNQRQNVGQQNNLHIQLDNFEDSQNSNIENYKPDQNQSDVIDNSSKLEQLEQYQQQDEEEDYGSINEEELNYQQKQTREEVQYNIFIFIYFKSQFNYSMFQRKVSTGPDGNMDQEFQEEYQEKSQEVYQEEGSNQYDSQFEKQGNESSQEIFQRGEGEYTEGQEGEYNQQFEGQEIEQQEGQEVEQYEGQEGDQYEGQEGEMYEGQEQFEQSGIEQQEGSQMQNLDIPLFGVVDTERDFNPQILAESVLMQNIVWNNIEIVVALKSLEIVIQSNSFEGLISKQLSFIELYTLIQISKEGNLGQFMMDKISISENLEVLLDIEPIEFDFQEAFTIEEGQFEQFLQELNGFEINMEDLTYVIQFIKPQIEVLTEGGQVLQQMEVDNATLQSIVQRGFHFDFQPFEQDQLEQQDQQEQEGQE